MPNELFHLVESRIEPTYVYLGPFVLEFMQLTGLPWPGLPGTETFFITSLLGAALKMGNG